MISIFLALGAGLWLLVTVWQLLALRRSLTQTSAHLQDMQSQLAGLCAAGVGTDQKMQRLEQKLRQVAEQQQWIASPSKTVESYEHAIRLARKGLSPQALMQSCDLSSEAAHLITRLHGQDSDTTEHPQPAKH